MREGGGRQDGVEWGGKWDNCNSIINKYILKNRIPLDREASEPRDPAIFILVVRQMGTTM